MSRMWIRRRPDTKESVLAGLVATGAALVTASATFYVVRLMLSREPLDLEPPREESEP